MLDFKDKLIVVTGGARGIGRAVAFEYAKHGAKLILVDVLGEELDKTADDMRQAGYHVEAFQCDLASNEAVSNLGNRIIKEMAVPDIIHNNAFWSPLNVIDKIDIESIRKALDICVLGYLRVTQAFLPSMMKRKSGYIVNTSSPNGIAPSKSAAAIGLSYNLCKAADISMSQCMAASLQEYGIGVSVIYPGATLTEAVLNPATVPPPGFPDGFLDHFKKHGTSAEEAAAVFVEGVRQEKFLVTTYPRFEEILVEYAKNGLDPRVDYSKFQLV